MASDQGNPEAKYKMAIMYLDGQGTIQDLTKAYYLFKESSHLDYGKATNIFSIPIDYSKSNDVDYIKVAAMFATVCEKRIDSLEYNLGYLYSQDSTFIYNNCSVLITANVFLEKKWYEKAADKGNPKALYELGVASENKNRQEKTQDLSMAVSYFKRAYTIGNIDATYKLASMYLHGYGVSQDLKKAFSLLNEAADMGYNEAYETLNNFNPDDEESKLEAVRKMLEVSAETGHVLSQYKLGILALDTKSSYNNIKEAIKWLEMVSDGGFINAHYSLGLLLETDNSSEKEYQKIVSLYQMAADKGHEQASFRLAQLYHHKPERDYVEAFSLYTLAAQQGYQPAQLAICVSSKLVWERMRNQLPDNAMTGELDYVSCFRMWENLAERGDVELQYNLGMMYEENNVDLALSEAARWYSRAADCSHNLALYHLGRLYEFGRGVNQDYSKAIKYYQIASKLGNTDALYQLGVIYQDGKGIEQNTKKAIGYYTQAAEKGNSMAQYALGRLYEEGKLLSKDILEVVKWYSISNSQGNERAQKRLYDYFDELYTIDSFYGRWFQILSRIVEINSNRNKNENNKLLGSVHFKLGYIYFYGYGSKLDYKKALEYFRESTKICDNDVVRFFSEIIYENIPASLKEKYIKKLDMFETAIDQLDLEDIYELGLIYYHGINSTSEDLNTNGTQVIVPFDYAKSSVYFKMVIKEQLSDHEFYARSSYYLGMMYLIDVEDKNQTRRANYYLNKAFHGGYSNAKALLNYIKKEETNKAAAFKHVYEWHKDNYDSRRLKIVYNLGFMYYKGLGIDQDYTNAMRYFTDAANQKYMDAQLYLGILYEKGHGIDQDWSKAREWYIKAANQNNSNANHNLGSIYYFGRGVELPIKEMFKAANQNNSIANHNLGSIYYFGRGVEVNYKLAFQYYEIAANQGDVNAQLQLGFLYSNGHGTDQDWTKAREWYIKAANQNDSIANHNLAANQGDVNAQLQLGFLYSNGHGTDQDWTKAREWYTKAANQNDSIANYNLGNMYYYGRGVEVNYKVAFQYYETAANQGYVDAQLQLADMYNRGLGVEKDSGEAIKIYLKIPDKNDYIWITLGEIYHSADTQFQDFSEALECYKQAEGENKSYALRGLGLLYEHGDGVEKDYEKAFEYYKLSEYEGNKGAYYNIALLYYYGKGVAKDFTAAFGYFEQVVEEEPDEDCTYVLVEVENDTESESVFDQRKKYSVVPESIIYGEAHFYLGVMNEKGQEITEALLLRICRRRVKSVAFYPNLLVNAFAIFV
ncbi:HCP-like protein [Backusella circina FSU 941]|nr:HCP-like protein [Backusella circina FSU 941]